MTLAKCVSKMFSTDTVASKIDFHILKHWYRYFKVFYLCLQYYKAQPNEMAIVLFPLTLHLLILVVLRLDSAVSSYAPINVIPHYP